MDEFIFPIEKVFSSDPDGVLEQNGCQAYYIGPYQRGYKWGSSTRYEQVPQMLIDMYEAMDAKTEEYYLQYITLKKSLVGDKHFLEVIDGQQRLTTLSLLFYRLAQFPGQQNIAKDRVVYARYTDDQGNPVNVFDRVEKEISTDPAGSPTQDLYYLISAASCIDQFLRLLKGENLLAGFSDYVRNHVLLIVNIESEFVRSEDVFANLNDNKVKLTDSYLIKGLLLTHAVYRNNASGGKNNYREILDQRRIMGRTWDEIMMWISDTDVAHFFFGHDNREEGMTSLLDFVYDLLKPGSGAPETGEVSIVSKFAESLVKSGTEPESTDLFPLFNKYNESIRQPDDARKALVILKHVYLKLRSIYENHADSTLFNLLGYVFFADNIELGNKWVKETGDVFRKRILRELIEKSTLSFKKDIIQMALKLIPCMNEDITSFKKSKSIPLENELSNEQLRDALRGFDYPLKNSNAALRNLLLSFSVFPEISDKSYRFNFCQYDREDWSFEHIFPQHPSGKLKIPPIAISVVCSAINSEITSKAPEQQEKLKQIRDRIKGNETLDKEDIEMIGFLYDCSFDINQCGNMALLSRGLNSALSNNPYIAKRPVLIEKAVSGSFVPAHTMGIFNKSLAAIPEDTSFTPELSKWNVDDVTAHMIWQIERNSRIRKQLEDEYREI